MNIYLYIYILYNDVDVKYCSRLCVYWTFSLRVLRTVVEDSVKTIPYPGGNIPTWAPEGPRGAQRDPRGAPEGPRGAQRGPRGAPGVPRGPRLYGF